MRNKKMIVPFSDWVHTNLLFSIFDYFGYFLYDILFLYSTKDVYVLWGECYQAASLPRL